MKAKLTDRPVLHLVPSFCAYVLISLFAILSFLLIALGIQAYQHVTQTADKNTVSRIGGSYIVNKVRAQDVQNAIEVTDDAQVGCVLVLKDENGEYETRIFCFDGELCEQYAACGTALDPENAETLMRAEKFDAALSDGLLNFALTCEGGVISQSAAVRCTK